MPSPVLPARSLIALLLASAAAPALAAEAPAESTGAPDSANPGGATSIIVTAGRSDDRLPDESGTLIFAGKLGDIAVLGDIPPVPSRNLRVALADIPGLLVSEVSNGSWASLSYRGLGEPHESWNILTLQDAVPAVPDMYSYPAGYFIPPLELVDRVEFIRGASGLLYGPQPGGAINYVMRGPRREEGAEGQARLTLGSWDARSGLANVAVSDGQFAADGFIQYSEGDGPRRVNSDHEQTSARLRGHYIGDAATLTLALDYYQGRFGEPGGLSAARLAADRRDGSTARDRLRIERFAPTLALDWQVDDQTQVTARAFYSRFERESWRQAGGSFGQVTPYANVLVRQLQVFDTAGIDLRARHDFGGQSQHSLTIGVLGHTSDAPVFVDKGASNADFTGSAGALARAQRSGDTLAVFGEVKLGFGDVQIVPGFRLERLRQRVVETLDLSLGSATGGAPGGANGVLGNREDTQTVPLYGIGITWDAGDNLRFVANASRGFKPLLYNDGVTFQAGIDAAGTFDASYAFTIEGGLQAEPADPLRIDASLFRVEFENQVGFLAGPLVAAPPFGAVGAGGARRQNVGSMRNQGVDLAVRLDLIGPDGIAKGDNTLRLSTNLQLLDADFTDGAADGFTPQYAPEHLLRSTLAWMGKDGARAALTFTSVGDQQGADNNVADFFLPGYEVLDASVEWPVAGGFTIGAGVNNLLDEDYAGRVRPGGGGGFDPGAPRNVFLSIGWRG
ncbi:TonB-dependent receptor family protein [Porphyrobacter sp. LM 6]|uniref:TonB-dependent receptor family protein n=1 Tax=Porphyrobacter sp. LM 6 TaxID=1896196 RepID=UPI000847147B|nr:TonB-dependent receptor [Porphyrobacter sp. LM 6]AOL93064.1 Outer membrane receptor for Fe3+-dicitrate [Porphyrobacter sp. LM 6]